MLPQEKEEQEQTLTFSIVVLFVLAAFNLYFLLCKKKTFKFFMPRCLRDDKSVMKLLSAVRSVLLALCRRVEVQTVAFN